MSAKVALVPSLDETPAALPRQGATPALFFAATLLFVLTGSGFNYAFIIFARHLTGSDGWTGLLNVGGFVIPLLTAPFVGTWIEGRAAKRPLLAAKALWATTATLMAASLSLDERLHSPAVLLGLSVANGLSFAFLMPLRLTLLRDLVPPDRLARATLTLNLITMLGFGGAPPLVGMAKDGLSWHGLFVGIAALFWAAIALFSLVRTRAPAGGAPAEVAREARGLRAAWAYTGRRPLVRQLLLAALPTFGIIGPLQVLVPSFLKNVLQVGEARRGLVMSTLGLGILAGGVVSFSLNRSRRRGALVIAAQAATGALVVVTALERSSLAVALSLFGAGLGVGVGASLLAANLQTNLDDTFRGRVLALYSAVVFIFPPFVGAAAGPLADRLTIAPAIGIIGGAAFAVAALFATGAPALRTYS